jgi:hypothetical protein
MVIKIVVGIKQDLTSIMPALALKEKDKYYVALGSNRVMLL